jgi:hypothetical protein
LTEVLRAVGLASDDAEIITPEMIAAGVRAWDQWAYLGNAEFIVTQVYTEMRRNAHSSISLEDQMGYQFPSHKSTDDDASQGEDR